MLSNKPVPGYATIIPQQLQRVKILVVLFFFPRVDELKKQQVSKQVANKKMNR